MRKEFEMTEEQYSKIIEACRPVPYMIIGGIGPRSPQENANMAWEDLGRKLGFNPLSVQPVEGKNGRFFTAETAEEHDKNHVDEEERVMTDEEKQSLKIQRTDIRREDLRALLDLYMCSDPWPLTTDGSHEAVGGFLDGAARRFGYEGWVVAYHELKA